MPLFGKSSASAVQITKTVVEHGKEVLSIDHDALQQIFCTKAVNYKHVAIYSVAGMLRKGKSFFLTLAIRYLQFKEKNKESKWMDSKSDILEGAFEYKAGPKGHTQGILVWSEPFWLLTAKGNKVAVFLIDTQGLFDEKSNVTMDNILFSLSTFLSSFQIYNMDNVLNQMDLGRLRTFIEFGNRMYESNALAGQTLLFLLRNWQNVDYYDYGLEGGQKYLKEILDKTRDTSEDYKVLCQKIDRSFQDVKCALLPYPGKKVAVRGKDSSSIKISDIDEDFLKAIDGLFGNIFANISSKNTGDSLLKGEDVVNQIVTFSNNIKDKAFTADTLYRTAAESLLANVVQRCEYTFNERIQENAGKYIQPEALNEIYTDIVEEVMKTFDEDRKVSSETDIIKCRQLLQDSLNERKFVLQNFNAVYERGMDENYRNWLKIAKRGFETTLAEVFKIPKDKKSFSEIYDLNNLVTIKQQSAEETLKILAEEHNLFDKATCELFHEKLTYELSVVGDIWKNKHTVAKVEVQKNLQEGLFNALKLYKKQFKEGLSYSIGKNDVAGFVQSALKLFDKANVDNELPMWQEERERLQTILKNLKEVSEEYLAIKETAINAGQSVQGLVLAKKKEFKAEVKKIGNAALTDVVFQTLQDQMLQSCSNDEFRSCRSIIEDLCKNVQSWCHLKKQIKEEFKRFKYLSEFYLAVCPLELSVPKQRTFWQRLRKSKVPDVFQNIDTKLEDARKKLAQIEADSDTEKPEWMLALQRDFFAIKNNIEVTHSLHKQVIKVIEEEKCHKIHKLLVWRYTEQMIEMLNGKHLTPENLIKVHNNIISICNKETDANVVNSEAAKEVKHFFKVAMGVQLANWEEYNKFHTAIFPRQLTRFEEFKHQLKSSIKGFFEGISARKIGVKMVATIMPPESI